MGDIHHKLVQHALRVSTTGPGELSSEVRADIIERLEGPEPLGAFVRKVGTTAWRVTPQDIDGLKAAGYSEDQIFEAIVQAASHAALTRLNRGLELLGRAPCSWTD